MVNLRNLWIPDYKLFLLFTYTVLIVLELRTYSSVYGLFHIVVRNGLKFVFLACRYPVVPASWFFFLSWLFTFLLKHIYVELYFWILGFPGGSDGEEAACSAGSTGSVPGQEDPWRRAWQPTPVFLPAEFRGQRSWVGYSPWDPKESDTGLSD